MFVLSRHRACSLHHLRTRRYFSTPLPLHSHLIVSGSFHQHQDNTTLWNSLLKHYSFSIYPEQAIHLYKQTLCFVHPGILSNTFSSLFLLKACATSGRLREGKQIHCVICKKGFTLHVYVHTALVDMYAACGDLVNAKKSFDEMPERNSVSWNVLITGAARWGEFKLAELLFNRMPNRNVVTWTGMIDGYARAHQPIRAVALFVRMMAEGEYPTEVTILAVIPALSSLGVLDLGRSVHAYSVKTGFCVIDVRVQNSVIDMYAKCGSMENAFAVFEEMAERRNLVSWTTVISGFAMHGLAKEAVELFDQMGKANVKPNRVTFLSVLNACSHGGLVEEGLRFFSSMVYEYVIEPEIKHYGCVVDMLGRVGRLEEAEMLIAKMPMNVNAVVWRILLGCCSKQGNVEIGKRVMRRTLELEKGYSGDYVILSNILTENGRFEDAVKLRALMDDRNVVKVPGISLDSTNYLKRL